jgi:hypothetical protein
MGGSRDKKPALPSGSTSGYYSPPMRLFRSISALTFAALLALPAHAEAQANREVQIRPGRSLDDLENGARLRLLVPGGDAGERLEGRFRGFGTTSLVLEVDGTNRDLPISSLLVVEESYRDRKRAALVGVVVALVGVYAWDFFGPHPRYTNQDTRYKENYQALAISVPVAALIGAGIGWHRWRPISAR